MKAPRRSITFAGLGMVAAISVLLASAQSGSGISKPDCCREVEESASYFSARFPFPLGNSGYEPVRVVDDPWTGERWLLERDTFHPANPGRWLLLAAAAKGKSPAGERGCGSNTPAQSAKIVVIHAGDQLIVEAHSAVLNARFEAVALGSAAAGGEFQARLKVGRGEVINALALNPGHAAFADRKRVWR